MEIEQDIWLKQIPPQIAHYFSGFVDGEGSFNVSLRQRNDHTLGWQVVLTFNVSQRDKTVLALLKRHLGCGRMQERKDGVWYYVVSNPRGIKERIIPFFKKYGFLSGTKKTNFSIWSKIAEMVFERKHLTASGLEEIIKLRETLNLGRGRKRKYELTNYQQSLLENPQRLYAKARPRKRETDKI